MAHSIRPPARRLAAVATLGLLLATLPAAEPPARERLRPEGIDGALVLCGDRIPDTAATQFLDLAGKDLARVVLVTGGDAEDRKTADRLAERWQEGKATVQVIEAKDAKDERLLAALKDAAGVWLLDRDAAALAARYRGSDAARQLTAVLQRNGVVGGSGPGVPALAEALTDGTPGLGLLPGAVVASVHGKGSGTKGLLTALEGQPGRLGLGIEGDTALVVRGRELDAVGDGAIVAVLGKGGTRPARTLEIRPKMPSDLTMLRRAALARAAAPFPPKEVVTPEVPKGALVIVGGGVMPADVTRRFIELAGGPDALIVVLPTANPDPLPLDGGAGFLRRAGAKNVVVLPGRRPDEVDDPKNLEVIKKAGGVWFGGGRQWRFVDAYEGTKALDAFRGVLARGGVIGGSSAGASIQADYLCRGSPLGNLEIAAEGYERGLGFLPGVAVDQHFAQRERFADMTGLMKTYPQLLGIGLDEGTAIVVRGHVAEVMGLGQAHFYDAGRAVEPGRKDYESGRAGTRYDLKGRKFLPAEEK